MPAGDRRGTLAEQRVIGEGRSVAREGPRLASVRNQDAQPNRLRRVPARPDLVERLLQSTVQRLAGEACEVDPDIGRREGLLEVRPQADRLLGPLADEDAAACAGENQPFVRNTFSACCTVIRATP